MPRLQGKSSTAPALVSTLLILSLVALVLLEYFGVIDLVPNFGR